MKAPALWFALALSTGSLPVAAEILPGASLEEVRATLGTPRGQLHVNGRQVLFYEHGSVELRNGALIRVGLRSPEEQALLVVREEHRRAEQETRRAQMVAEGTALRDRKLADPAFLAAPVAFQVAYWEDFARRFPVVSCVEPLTIARLRLNEQLEEKRRREADAVRIADLEERLAAAERRPAYYPVRSYSRYHGRNHYRSSGLGPFTYTFFDTPLPPYSTPSGSPYSTPSGNPAGSLTGLPINPPTGYPALPGWSEPDRPCRDRWSHDGHAGGRGANHHRTDRM